MFPRLDLASIALIVIIVILLTVIGWILKRVGFEEKSTLLIGIGIFILVLLVAYLVATWVNPNI